MQEAINHQQQVIDSMRKILTAMAKNEGFQQVVNLLYEIKKNQENVLELTDEEKERHIRQLLNPSTEKGNDDEKPKR